MIRLYVPRMTPDQFTRMIELHEWVVRQFGAPDYHKNYSLDFGDDTNDWCCYTFYDATQAFWTQARFSGRVLTEAQWQAIIADPGYDNKRTFGTLELPCE
jgi:hypothetical protein